METQQPTPSGSVRTIAVATDFSAIAEHALDLALDLAQRLNAQLTLIHVLPAPLPPASASPMLPTEPLPHESALPNPPDTTTPRLEALAQKCRERSVRTSYEMIPFSGNAPASILQSANDHFADLLVLGTHGRSGLERLLLGSVAEGVLRRAQIPVLAVPLAPTGDDPE